MTRNDFDAVIPLQRDFDPSELNKVKLVQEYDDGTSKKIELPKTDGTSIESLLYCLNEFEEARKELDLTEGDELFTSFRKILEENARANWDNEADGKARTPNQFQAVMKSWKRLYMTSQARQDQIDYIESLTKPKNMDVRIFGERLKTLVRYLKELPSEDDDLTISESRVKNILFRAMPRSWQTQFIRSNQRVGDTSFASLVEYMTNEKRIADYADGRNNRNGNGNGHDNESKSTRNNKRERNSNGNKSHQNDDESDNEESDYEPDRKRGGTRLTPSSECPIHEGSHLWRRCFDNPDGDNYHPRDPITGKRNFASQTNKGNGRERQPNNHRGGEYAGPKHGNVEQYHVEMQNESRRDYSAQPTSSQRWQAMPHAMGRMQSNATESLGW